MQGGVAISMGEVKWAFLRSGHLLKALKEARGWALRILGEKHSKQEEQPMQRPLIECMSLPLSIHIFHAFTWPFIEFKGVRGKCLLGHLSHCARSSFGQGPHNGQLHSHPTGHPDMSRRAHTQTYTPTLVQRDLCTAAIEKGSVIV